jgi:hypothetical protein
MSNIVYTYGRYETDFEDIVELCGTWWYDSSFYKESGMDYNVDREQFKAMSDLGMLMMVLGREEDTGKLVTCYMGVVMPYYFNNGHMMANEVVWCVHPEYRKTGEAQRLLDNIELAMKECNIDMYSLCIPMREGRDKLEEHLIKDRGFFPQDKVLMRSLRNG